MLSWFEPRRARQLADYDRDQPWIGKLLRELDALYLFGTMGMEAVLKADGTVLVSRDDSWGQPAAPPSPWRAATIQERTASLVIARTRIPEVAELLPSRPPDAADCPRCNGTGRIIQEVVCMDCGALGWVPSAA